MAHPLASGVYPYDVTKRAEAIQVARQTVEQDVDEPQLGPPKRVTHGKVPEKHMGGRCVYVFNRFQASRCACCYPQLFPPPPSAGRNFSNIPTLQSSVVFPIVHDRPSPAAPLVPPRPPGPCTYMYRQNDPRAQWPTNFSLALGAVGLTWISAKHSAFESSSKVAHDCASRRCLLQ